MTENDNNALYNWEEIRQTGERNELFKEYLGECDNVRLAALHDENVDTSKMDGLRNKFN